LLCNCSDIFLLYQDSCYSESQTFAKTPSEVIFLLLWMGFVHLWTCILHHVGIMVAKQDLISF
jgi:hypothetical protein